MRHPTNTPHRVVGFGDNVVDRFVDRGQFFPGGNSINFAVFARELGADSAYLGVFADDEASAHIQFSLAQLDVSSHRSVIRHGETGWCDVRVVDGDRVFGDWSGGVTIAEPFVLNDADLEYLSGFELIHSGAYAGVESQLPRLRNTGALVVFDLSDEPEQREDAYVSRVAPFADLIVASVADLDWADAEEYARYLVSQGAAMSLVTRGTEGSGLYDGEQFVRAEAVPIDAVDTMGCGDAFITAFVLDLLGASWSRTERPSLDAVVSGLESAAQFAADRCAIEGAYGFAKEYSQ